MFEIRVAVIGYVSVGKTTLINALFGHEYGEVAMKRTTAVVNNFRMPSTNEEATVEKKSKGGDGSEDDSVEFVAPKLSADVVLEETKSDNEAFRNSNVVQVRTYDIALDEPLHKMRSDTALTIVDIPGINEAGTSSKYREYVNDNWHTFDIAVLVMDARQGVNTEEQHDLLKLAKSNLDEAKSIPLIILCNKVDDPDNDEQTALLNEARKTIADLFDVSDRKSALEAFLDSFKQPGGDASDPMVTTDFRPAVVPVSAIHAFVYRCGSRLSFEEFSKMDADFVDKIGKDSYGRRWKRFSKAERLKKAYETVSEPEQCQDGLEASNFGAFTKVLSACIGDEKNQTLLVEKQISVALDRMEQAKPGSDLAAELLSAYFKLTVLGKSTEHLPKAFWGSFKGLKKEAFGGLESDLQVDVFADLVDQLFNYAKVLQTLKLPGEVDIVQKETRELVLHYAIGITTSAMFKAKSCYEQRKILGSMLLACDRTFDSTFGSLKLHLEFKYWKLQATCGKFEACKHSNLSRGTQGEGTEYCSACRKTFVETKVTHCPICTLSGRTYSLSWTTGADGDEVGRCNSRCGIQLHLNRLVSFEMKVDGGKLVPVDQSLYDKYVGVEVPDSLSNKKHFGYLLWKACELLREVGCSDLS